MTENRPSVAFRHYDPKAPTTWPPEEQQRGDFEFFIPVVAERFFLPGSDDARQERIDGYADELGRLVDGAGLSSQMRLYPHADAGPGAPWPVIVGIILAAPGAVENTLKLIDRIRAWAAEKGKEPIFSEGALLCAATEYLSRERPGCRISHVRTFVRRRYPEESLEHAVSYCFAFRELDQASRWQLVIMSSSGNVLGSERIVASVTDLPGLSEDLLDRHVARRNEYLDTRIHDRPVPMTHYCDTQAEAEERLETVTELFPEWNFEIVRSGATWRVQVRLDQYQEASAADAERRKATLNAQFFDRQFEIVETPPVFVVREVRDV